MDLLCVGARKGECLKVIVTVGTNQPLDTFRSYGATIIIDGNPNPNVCYPEIIKSNWNRQGKNYIITF
jgi:hypothetical protein